jgi:hypothetical protein
MGQWVTGPTPCRISGQDRSQFAKGAGLPVGHGVVGFRLVSSHLKPTGYTLRSEHSYGKWMNMARF